MMMSHGGTRSECSVCGESQVGEGGEVCRGGGEVSPATAHRQLTA